MPWNPENIFVAMLALLAFASPAQADLIDHTYWAYIPNPPFFWLFFFKFKFIYFNWRRITLQYCFGFAMKVKVKMKVKSLSRVRLFVTPMDCSLSGSSVHGIFQAIVLEWIAISFSRGSFHPRDRTWVSRIVDRRFTI